MGRRLQPASPVPLPRGLVTAAKKAEAGSLGLRPEVPERGSSGSGPSPGQNISLSGLAVGHTRSKGSTSRL